ncbi:O-antigen biosynthesis protein [Methylomarinovum tepidoasis]|uniref:O-antigen biosynthesis protein n=1 Tax=Methylomarinovum tepidoasis TaxID=2840183 RepID=A0AAU9CV59_9GAMM|nr:glycosyltransferase [Methylomarinovum sp. IN45]BCX87974.1 O-antigen biosynthesis protein [Methylomarinovum sp. IN45]
MSYPVSIIVRTKDRPQLLRQALGSLAGQTYPRLEVIVVNDGGCDVREVLEPFRSRFTEMRYLDLQPGRGRAAAANAGLGAARGRYLGFLDDDDWLAPEHVAGLVEALTQHREKAAYAGVQCVERINGEWRETHVYNEPYEPVKLMGVNFIPIHAVLFDRALLDGCRFDEAFEVYEDWDFWLQVARHTDFYHLDRVTAFYRLTADDGSGVHGKDDKRYTALRLLYAKWDRRWSAESRVALLVHAHRGFEATEAHIRNLEKLLAERERSLAQARIHGENLEKLLAERERSLAQARVHGENLEKLLAERDRSLAQARIHGENLEKLLAEKDRIQAMTQTHADNLKRLLAEREKELEARQRRIEDMEAMLAASRREIAHWQTAYREVMQSTSWRISAPVRMLGRRLRRLHQLVRHRSCIPHLMPVHQVEDLGGGRFRAQGPDPHFHLGFPGPIPSRWVRVSLTMAGNSDSPPTIYYDTGDGFNECQCFTLLPTGSGNRFERVVRLPDAVQGWRFDPRHAPGEFRIKRLEVTEIGSLLAATRLFRPEMDSWLRQPDTWARETVRLIRAWCGPGKLEARRQLVESVQRRHWDAYQSWFRLYGRLTEADREAIRKRIISMRNIPTFSILMPVHDPDVHWLRAALDSVLNQLYPHWELCIVDDASHSPKVRRVLEEYRRRDPRIRVRYRDCNGHISVASNDALAMATGDYIALLDHDDELAEHALYLMAEEITAHPHAVLLYSDEDKLDELGRHFDPYFKPDWNPLLLLGQNYFNHLSVYRADAVRACGGFREGFEGSQDWDLALRVTETLSPEQIRHVPFILYHWRAVSGSTAKAPDEKSYPARAAVRAVQEHLQRLSLPAEVESLPGGHCRVRFRVPTHPPKVSLIIPTRDGYELLSRCVETLVEKTEYPDYEVIVVDNRSQDPQSLAYLDELSRRQGFQVLRYDEPFNFSAINNFAVRHAQGEILGFLNNDLEILEREWLQEMVAHALHPETGAVGAMLYYPDGRIQHAGIILGIGGVAGHPWVGWPPETPGQMGRLRLAQHLTAVTAACLLVRRDVFLEVGGFDEKGLKVAFNDVDLCLKIHNRGYRNVWTPLARLFHHESATRGYEDTPEKQRRFQREIEIMQRRWGSLLRADPAYNPNLTLERCDFSLSFQPRVTRPWRVSSEGGAIGS